MKNAFRKVAAATLAAAMMVPFAGCSKNESNNDSSAADNSVTSVADGENGKLVIGGIGPITGAAAVYGNAVKNGAQLAVNEINAAGGVNGMTLELNFQDDEHDPEKSVNAYNTLKDAGMKLLVGTVTSAPCVAVSAEAAKDNMFLLTPSGSAIDAITAGDNCFRVCFTDPGQGKIAADYIADNIPPVSSMDSRLRLRKRAWRSPLRKLSQLTQRLTSPYRSRRLWTVALTCSSSRSTTRKLLLFSSRLSLPAWI